MPQIESYITESLEAKVFARSINQPQTSYAVAASFSEFELKKILIEKWRPMNRLTDHTFKKSLQMDYLPKRHWSNLEKKRSRIMIKAIDKLLFERRLMHNLEKFIGGHDYGNDLRLFERTI
nr:hypothetical protein [Tanacetum cinerariifolium]